MSINRRQILQGASAAIGLSAIGAPAIAQSRTKIRVGYLHTLAVDGQMWLAQHQGAWAKHGLEPEFRQFTTGLELFQAMVGGSLDVLSTGAVISNFPARGQGRMFMANCVEFATAQLWVRDGIKSFEDLKGKRIATTTGTTAHVFLDNALRANKVDPSKDVDIVNQRMSDAVTSFISGAVPAVALWVPFNITVRNKVPEAKMLVDASKFFPDAAIISGWAARNDFFDANRETIASVIRAWADGNALLVAEPDKALEILQKNHYPQVPLADLKEQYAAQRVYTNGDWRKLYSDGTVTKWLQQVTDFFVKFGGIQNPVPAAKYFDPGIYLNTIKS